MAGREAGHFLLACPPHLRAAVGGADDDALRRI